MRDLTVALVAFDFDGTLVEGDAGVHFARYLVGERYKTAAGSGLGGILDFARLNLATTGLLARSAGVRLSYKLGELDRRGMVEKAYEGFRGQNAAWIREEMETYAREALPGLLREDLVDQLRHHVERGDHVVILSTGLHGLIWPLRETLGVDVEVVACRLREQKGSLTGRVEGPLDASDKIVRLHSLAKRTGHSLEEAWAYGDHEDDARLLARVGEAFAVHPTSRMWRIARREGWPILYDG